MINKKLFAQTKRIVFLILRRDHRQIILWVLGFALTTLIIAFAYTQLVPTVEERLVMAETMANPAVTAMFGPGFGIDNYQFGPIMGHQMLLFTALIVAIMNILLTTKHTRLDEESGRLELIRSFPVGKLSNLTATLITLFGVNFMIFITTGLALFATRIETIDLKGSLIYGGVLGITGIFFAALTSLFAQLTASARAANGFSFTFLIFFYALRAIGDVNDSFLTFLSPLGLVIRTEAFVGNYISPLLLVAFLTVLVCALAYYLNSIRDVEAGFFKEKAGRKNASLLLKRPVGLALRLLRTTIIAWILSLFILGIAYGSILGDLETYLAAMDLIQAMLIEVEGFSLVEQFLPMLLVVMAMVSTIPPLIVILRLAIEENKNRVEPLLATAVSRQKILGSFLVVALIVAASTIFISGLGLWAAGTTVLEGEISLKVMVTAALSYVPASWFFIGFATLLIGFFPNYVYFAWLYLGYSFFTVYMGDLIQLPAFLKKLSPFGHIQKYPLEELSLPILTIITAATFFLIFLGSRGYQKRDIYG